MKCKSSKLTLGAAVTAVLLTGCASKVANNSKQDYATNGATPTQVQLNLITPRFTNIHYTNAPLNLVVVDNRNYHQLGTIASVTSESLLPVYSKEKVSSVLVKTLLQALTYQGHKVTLSSDTDTDKSLINDDQCSQTSTDQNTMIVRVKNLYAKGFQNDTMSANALIEVNLRSCKDGKFHFMDKQFSSDSHYSESAAALSKEDIQKAIETVLNKSVNTISTNEAIQKFMSTNFETIQYLGSNQ